MKKIYLSALLSFITIVLFAQTPGSWSPHGPGGGGALFSPSINPANSSEYYISCDMSQLFHTTDFGLSYSQSHFSELQAGHNSKISYTKTAGLLYCIDYSSDLIRPVKSLDNGLTWSYLSGNPDDYETTYTIDADYNNPLRLIISYYGSIYFSNDGGNVFKQIHTALNNGEGNIVGGVFFDGANIYIGSNDGLIFSNDNGSSFSTSAISGIPLTEEIFSFAAAKSAGITRFFCLTGAKGNIYVGQQGSDYNGLMQGIYTLDYGNGVWTKCMNGITPGTDYPVFVAMAANDINTCYLAGSNSSSFPDIMKTSDAGLNWSHTFKANGNINISTGWSGQGGDRNWTYGECPFGISVCMNDANAVVFGDYGFVHKSSDGGNSWEQAYVKKTDENPAGSNTPTFKAYHSIGLENTTCWQIFWKDAANMFACYSDIKGCRSTDAGQTWSFNYTGHAANSMYRIVKNPSNNYLYAATSNIHDMYQSTRLADAQLDASDSQGKIIYSTDNGANWLNIHSFNHPVFWLAIDPNNSNKMYASVIHYGAGSGLGGIYVCSDLQNGSSSTWTKLPNPPRTEGHPASIVVLNDGKVLCTFSGRRTASGFTASSGTYIYNPIGNSWTDVSDPGMHYWTKDVVIDPNDATQNTWYVGVFSGWGGAPNGLGGLYRTIDRGAHWTKINNLDRVTSICFNPANLNQVFLTTEQNGLWTSTDITLPNPNFSLVSNYPFRQPERVYFNPFNTKEIWISSFGNGMKSGLITSTGIQFSDETPNDLEVFPNPSSGKVFVKLNDNKEKINSIIVFDIQGKQIMQLPDCKVLDLSGFPNGTYFIQIDTHARQFSKKLILNKN